MFAWSPQAGRVAQRSLGASPVARLLGTTFVFALVAQLLSSAVLVGAIAGTDPRLGAQPELGETLATGSIASPDHAARAGGVSATTGQPTVHLTPSPELGSPPSVAATMVLANDTLVPGNFLAQSATGPYAVAYDGENGCVYVTTMSGDVVVINGTTNAVTAFVPVGVYPTDIAYDPDNGLLYVTNAGSNNVTIVDGSTNAVVGSIPVGTSPQAVAYDSANELLYIANSGSNNVTVANASTRTVVTDVQVGNSPRAIVYDDANGKVYVVNAYAGPTNGNVTVINGTTNTVVGWIPGGTYPTDIAYDEENGNLYLVNTYSFNVSVIDGTTDSVVGSFSVGTYPTGIVYDSTNDRLYVTNANPGSVRVIDPQTRAEIAVLPVGSNPFGLAFNSMSGLLYVANLGSNNVSVIDSATLLTVASPLVGFQPYAMTYDDESGHVYVASRYTNQVLVIDGATRSIVDTIRLPSGLTPEALAYNGNNGEIYVPAANGGIVAVIDSATNAVSKVIPIPLDGSDVALDAANSNLYVTGAGNDGIAVINGTFDTVTGSIPIGGPSNGVAYDPVHGRLYVTSLYSPNVTVIDPTTKSVVGLIPVGVYSNAIEYDSGNGYLYVTNGASYNITVIDSATDAVFATIPIGDFSNSVAYDDANGYLYVTNFYHSNITVIDGGTNSVVAQLSVGTTPSRVVYDRGSGDIYVANLNQGTLSIIPDGVPRYAVSFEESGLPGGMRWGVTLSGVPVSSISSTLTVHMWNGTFNFASLPNMWFSSTPHAGMLSVNGSATALTVDFASALPTATITFKEKGLAASQSWSVMVGYPARILSATVGLAGGSSAGTSLSVNVPLTGVPFTIVAPPNFGVAKVAGSALPDLNQVNVTASTTVTIKFGQLEILTFVASSLPKFQLYPGATWSVSLIPKLGHGGPPAQSALTSVGSISFWVPSGAAYRFSVTCSDPDYKVVPSQGGLHMPAHAVSKVVKFKLLTVRVVFKETGLSPGASWTVTILSGNSPALVYPLGVTKAAGAGAIVFKLPAGTYNWIVNGTAGPPAPGGGTTTLTYPSLKQVMVISF